MSPIEHARFPACHVSSPDAIGSCRFVRLYGRARRKTNAGVGRYAAIVCFNAVLGGVNHLCRMPLRFLGGENVNSRPL